MDTEQKERIKNFEERQKRKEKREKFGKTVFGNPQDGYYDFLGIFALPIYLIRLAGGLLIFLIGILIVKAFKKAK